MTQQQFLSAIQEYYGDYNGVQLMVMRQWLAKSKAQGRVLERLFAETIRSISNQYKQPPDVARLEPLLNRAFEEAEHEMLVVVTNVPRLTSGEIAPREMQDRFWEAISHAIQHRQPGQSIYQDEQLREVLADAGVLNQVGESDTRTDAASCDRAVV